MSISELILDEMNELVFVLDINLTIEYSNKATIQYVKEINQGQSFLDIISPSDRKRMSLKLYQAHHKEEQQAIIKARIVDIEKNDRWFVFSVKFVKQHALEGQLLLIANPVERLAFEESQILEREAALADSEQLGNIGSWWVNIDTKVNHWSKGNFDIWGIDPNDGPSSLEEVMKKIHPDDAKKVLSAIDQVSQTTERQDITFRMMKNDKPYRYFITRIRPWYINGELKEVKGVNVEVTDVVKTQKKLEDKLNIISRHNEKMAEYIFVNSHEVRRPMSNILSLVELVKNDKLSRYEFMKLLEKEATQLDNSIQRMNKMLSEEETILKTNLDIE